MSPLRCMRGDESSYNPARYFVPPLVDGRAYLLFVYHTIHSNVDRFSKLGPNLKGERCKWRLKKTGVLTKTSLGVPTTMCVPSSLYILTTTSR